MSIPRHISDFDKLELKEFEHFLASKGAELRDPTCSYEVIRFKANNLVSIIYSKATGILTFTGESEAAWQAFKGNNDWQAVKKTKRRPNSKKISQIIERDGKDCFFCGAVIAEGEETVEHILPLCHGGSHNIHNLALAHEDCNQKAGHLSIVAKIHLRDQLRKSGGCK